MTVRLKASSLRSNLEYSLKEAVYNLLSEGQDNDNRGVDDFMNEIDHLFVHSIADAIVQRGITYLTEISLIVTFGEAQVTGTANLYSRT